MIDLQCIWCGKIYEDDGSFNARCEECRDRKENELCKKCGYLIVMNCCKCKEFNGDE